MVNADPSISALIREVLAEELARLKSSKAHGQGTTTPAIQAEQVSISSDADLQAFVARLLEMAKDNTKWRDLEQGRLVFRLASGGHTPDWEPDAIQTSQIVSVDQGFFSERQVDQLAGDTRRIRLGKRVKMTPLARDRLRQRGIAIERIE